MSSEPPAYIPTIYDETHRAKDYMEPSIISMASRPTLIAYLEHHAPTTDGSFSVCIAGGIGVFVSKTLLDSIPEDHRPVIDTDMANQHVKYVIGDGFHTIGTALVPIILTDAETSQKFRIVLYALVLPDMRMGMFISQGSEFIQSFACDSRGFEYTFDFGDGGLRKVKGI